MARRKKAPEGYHRRQIAEAAEQLFRAQGAEHTTMDQIAQSAGYSKATLYAYFQNKREIAAELNLRSMELLLEHLEAALSKAGNTREKYAALCRELVAYQAQYPAYFETALGEIHIGTEGPDVLPTDRKTFEVGERVNREIAGLLQSGMERGDLRPGLNIPQTVFAFWAALSGVILLSAHKKAYLENVLEIPREEFLSESFDLFYRSIERSEPV